MICICKIHYRLMDIPIQQNAFFTLPSCIAKIQEGFFVFAKRCIKHCFTYIFYHNAVEVNHMAITIVLMLCILLFFAGSIDSNVFILITIVFLGGNFLWDVKYKRGNFAFKKRVENLKSSIEFPYGKVIIYETI